MYAELAKNDQGRYALPNGEYFTADDDIEALIKEQWIKTTVHHNHDDYYLVGFADIPMEGLIAKYPNVV
ncbi:MULTISPECIES: DUF5348 domain-containing protein [Niallia]|uniref:DUF5348 domain-containing protein n=1 Tax=Niallia circulans TaxID=1397 RepID=A0A553SG16_NIACI|nr:DUF5348 domain-containing protein [Niallia circulans]TRZ35937.1 hypothetical protein CEQ21_09955 [Niallia circulans]